VGFGGIFGFGNLTKISLELGTKREEVTFPSRFSLFEIDPHSFSFLQMSLLATATS